MTAFDDLMSAIDRPLGDARKLVAAYRDELTADRPSRYTATPADTAKLLALIEEFVDPDPCWYDHHGHCQAHGYPYTEPACPHARAKALLGQQEAEREAATEKEN